LNLVWCRGYEAIVACHALRSSLQNDFSEMRLYSRRCMLMGTLVITASSASEVDFQHRHIRTAAQKLS
jgi:hypothetical protein